VPVLGSLFAQELVARTSASRSRRVARSSALGAALLYLAVGSIPVLLGAIAHSRMPGIDPEQVLAVLAREHLPTLGHLVFVGALVSAILSTVDSALLVCGSLVSHNLAGLLTRDASERRKVTFARVSVVTLGAAAYVLASSAESVHALIRDASAFGSAGVCVVGCFALFSGRGGAPAAYAALLAGTVSWIYAAYASQLTAPFLCSLACALLAYLTLTALEDGRRGARSKRAGPRASKTSKHRDARDRAAPASAPARAPSEQRELRRAQAEGG
jgi:Na+/proline symporter